MDIKDKLKELEAQRTVIDQKIALLRELEGDTPAQAPIQAPTPERASGTAQDALNAINKGTKVLSVKKEGRRITTTEWIGGSKTGNPSEFID